MVELSPAGMERILAEYALPAETRVLIAVSGGSDSMALLTLLAGSAGTTNLELGVVHVNHQLRDVADQEAQLVRDYAERLGVTCRVVDWPRDEHPRSGVEAAARQFRYAAFTQLAQREHYDVLMTAHNLGDQAETVLFRLARAGSVAGATGIHADTEQRGLRVVRPLLGVPKHSLQDYCDRTGVPYVHDQSNDDTAYDRNFLRHEVLPTLSSRWPDTEQHLARFAEELTGLQTLADVTLRHLSGKVRLKSDEFTWQDVQNESTAVQKLLLQHLLSQWYSAVSHRQVLAVYSALNAGDGRERIVALSAAQALYIQRQHVRLRSPVIVADSTCTLGGLNVPARGAGGVWILASDNVPNGYRGMSAPMVWPLPVTIRHRQPGDWLQLAHGEHQKLGRFLTNMHVPGTDRDQLWVAASGHQVLWAENARPRQLFTGVQTAKIKAQLVFRPDDGGNNRDEF